VGHHGMGAMIVDLCSKPTMNRIYEAMRPGSNVLYVMLAPFDIVP
jgi:hypothetical protein